MMLHARRDYDRIQDPENKIGEDEPVFLVRAKDWAFVPTLLGWIKAHLDAGGDIEMAKALMEHIDKAKKWRGLHNREVKVADAPKGSLRL
jgi:hypothetical protein